MACQFFLILFPLFLAGASFGQGVETQVDHITGSRVIVEQGQAPKVIYHWTSLSKLAEIAGDKKASDAWVSFSNKVGRGSSVFGMWPQFKEHYGGGLFTWTHPTTGMMGGLNEYYGDIPIRIEIDSEKARVAKLDPHYMHFDKPAFQSQLKVEGVDIIDNGNEWIILNPKIIKNVTADIDTLRPIYKKELAHLEDPAFQYSRQEIHYVNFKDPRYRESHLKHAVETIKRFLATDPSMIPSWFRRDLDGKPLVSQAQWTTGAAVIKKIGELQDNEKTLKEIVKLRRNIEEIVKNRDWDWARADSLMAEFKERTKLYCLENNIEFDQELASAFSYSERLFENGPGKDVKYRRALMHLMDDSKGFDPISTYLNIIKDSTTENRITSVLSLLQSPATQAETLAILTKSEFAPLVAELHDHQEIMKKVRGRLIRLQPENLVGDRCQNFFGSLAEKNLP